jgi:hypothetical protein
MTLLGVDMPIIRVGLATLLAGVLTLGAFSSNVSAQATTGTNVIIRLRLTGDADILPPIRACLVDKLSHMPDVEVATTPREGVRFIVDLIAAKNAGDTASASIVVAETFPIEQFRPRMKEGENTEALLASIRYYTLLRLHRLLPAQSYEKLCSAVAADFGDKVLSKEYTERND